ncbi:MAG TPA: arylsulfatase, partial [Phenylobacterium sp.]
MKISDDRPEDVSGRAAFDRRRLLFGGATLAGAAALVSASTTLSAPATKPRATVDGRRPNILFLMSDDIGPTTISAYSQGIVGYRTPNIDRIAREGMLFTDYYGEQSCTAGRSAFLTGQTPLRTGMSKVGLPGSTVGLWPEDITLAEALKPLGYTTGQFGKNHLGDRNEFLPTVRGFDEFFGNLYHLFAEEEPEAPDYPKDPAFRAKFGPRGVLRCKASDRDDPTVDPRFGKVGKQVIEDTGPLTKKRMETVDDEFTGATIDFMRRSTKAGQPFFAWFNSTRMHAFTHIRPSMQGQSGMPNNDYADGMLEHDGDVGKLLKALDDLGVADNTIVVYVSDNGPNVSLWPDGGMTPFRSEKNTNWEGAFRVPAMIRWPGRVAPGAVSNEIVAHLDWFPTLMAAAGDTAVSERLLGGWQVGERTYKTHLDGFNLVPYLTGQQPKSPRREFFYIDDDCELVAVRNEEWKFVFLEQRAVGLQVWREPFTGLRAPKVFNLRMDPFERADSVAAAYDTWAVRHAFTIVPTQAVVAKFVATFQ